MMDRMGAEEGEVIEHPWVTRSIEGAQKRIELQNFQSRKRLLDYDDVMNQQREVVYSLRSFALEGGEELKAEAIRMLEAAMERPVKGVTAVSRHPEDWDTDQLYETLQMRFLLSVKDIKDPPATPTPQSVLHAAQEEARQAFRRKVEALDKYGRDLMIPNLAEQVLSQVMLRVIDEKWKDHLYDVDQLRNAIYYRAWGQKDPLVEYKKEAYEMFVDLMADLRGTFAEQFFKVQVSAGPPPPPMQQPRTFSGPAAPGEPAAKPARGGTADMVAPEVEPEPRGPVAPAGNRPLVGGAALGGAARGAGLPPGWEKTGRNEACPCGSGKKFKKCHGAGL
jgi:preprotein translocase subunit SecA